MFEPNERDEIPFHNAVKCAIATMTDKIISSDTDLLGICFYGTSDKKNLNEFDNLYVLQVQYCGHNILFYLSLTNIHSF